ncbi:MAG: pyridoxal phosphate-dependent aminotransferase [Planctomycetes bacterium]|nr:pyridoxal phosphate-dependent aminotransferase [Planctomycetota bacterium]
MPTPTMPESPPFHLERYFARWENTVSRQLSASDCRPLRVTDVLNWSKTPTDQLLQLRLGYTQSAGDPELRREIATFYPGRKDDDVLVVNAPQEALALALRAMLRPGDRVIVQTPCYQSLKQIALQIGCQVVDWPVHVDDNGFAIDWNSLHDLLHEPAAALITNFPHNPTGVQPTPDEWQHLVAKVEHHGLRWFSDEIYRGLAPDDVFELVPAACLTTRAVSLWGLSKSFGLAGLRLGWLVTGDRELRTRIEEAKDWSSICSNAVSEFLGLQALRAAKPLLAGNRRIIAQNGQRMASFARRNPGLVAFSPPAAGPVTMARVLSGNATDLATRVREKGSALLVPSYLFDMPDRWVRIGLGRADFDDALRRWEMAMRA